MVRQKALFSVIALLSLALAARALPSSGQVAALCDIAALWGCSENCSLGCDVCGASCNTEKSGIVALTASGKGLQALPESIGNLAASLTYLDVSNNNLIDLPESFGALVNLNVLFLGWNQLTTVPTFFNNFVNLLSLSFWSDFIDCAPVTSGNYINIVKTACNSQRACSDYDSLLYKSTCNGFRVCKYCVGNTCIRNTADCTGCSTYNGQSSSCIAAETLGCIYCVNSSICAGTLTCPGCEYYTAESACSASAMQCTWCRNACAGNAADCEPCVPGQIRDGSLGCSNCKPGSISTTEDATSCTLCPAGTFAATEGLTSCEDCPKGSFALTGARNCSPCTCSRCNPETGECLSNAGPIAAGVICGLLGLALVAGALFLFVKWRRTGMIFGRSVGGAGRSVASSGVSMTRTVTGVVGAARTDSSPWSFEPTTINFGLSGMQGDVGRDFSQDVVFTNASAGPLHISFRCPRSNKFTVAVQPEVMHVKKSGVATATVTARLHCTTTISEPLVAVATFGKTVEHADIRVSLAGKLSTRIDPDDLVVGELIGEGSFGTVNRGRWKSNVVAIKTLKDMNMDTVVDDFMREIDILEHVRATHIITFFGAVVTPTRLCIVTEFCPLGSLAKVIKAYKFSPRMKVRLASDIATGMLFLHEANILHRDLKPDNVLCCDLSITAPVSCKITDFGTSKAVSSTTMANMTKGLGTPLYMATEIMEGSTHYTAAADVFSFAVMVSEIWSGIEPYSDRRIETSWGLVDQVIKGLRPTLSRDLPRGLREIITGCWDRQPEQRPSFKDVVPRLAQIMRELEHSEAAGTVHVTKK